MANELKIDIEGTVNNLSLSERKGLLPLYEAIINSIQAISDSPSKSRGKIEIKIIRESTEQIMLDGSDEEQAVTGFIVTDNGIGFNTQNYESFKTVYSTYKKDKGCKGIGRFLWLKAFDSIKIESTFAQDNNWFKREFDFSRQGVTSEKTETSITKESKTTVYLEKIKPEFQSGIPSGIEEIARRIVNHCLLFFIYPEDCPQIFLRDDENESCQIINLNSFFAENIKDSLHQDDFTIGNHTFKIYHLRMKQGVSTHTLHFCANMYEVMSVKLKNKIPELQTSIVTKDEPEGFYYCGYLTSEYLDSIVNISRTKFDFFDQDDNQSLFEPSKNNITRSAVSYIKEYLSDFIDELKREKKEQIDEYVNYEHPQYRYLLREKPQVYDAIPTNLSEEELDLALHKEVQIWEREIKKRGIELDKQIKSQSDSSLTEKFKQYWTSVTELSKTCLAEYITRRKALLSVLEDTLNIRDDGRFDKEEVLHSLICPMRHTSDDIEFEEMNLWVVDERLAYHTFLASDKTLKSIPVIDCDSTKEPDIAVFDRAFAFSDSEEPFNSVTIIEFKKPDNDAKDPITQVGRYIDLICDGKGKKSNGQTMITNSGTTFRCYIICDLTDRMRKYCKDHDLLATPDNKGYTGVHRARNAYFEVISYSKLLTDAKKRNQIFFDKLFAPKLETAIHVPDVN